MYVAQPIQWTDRRRNHARQRRLPPRNLPTYTDYREVATPIREMVIREPPPSA